MYISVPWAIALGIAGVTGLIAVAGLLAARRGAKLPAAVVAIAHLLGGIVAGFLALAFFPALPAVAAVAGALTIRAVQSRAWIHVGMLMVGAGGAWTSMMGASIINDALDPAVVASDTTIPFLIGAAVLVGGLGVLIADARRTEDVNRSG